MNEFQERPELSAAGLVFLLGTLVLTPPLYGYLLALDSLPRVVLDGAPAVRVLPLVGLVVASLLLSRRLRRAGWPLRLLVVAVGGLLVAVLPPALPAVSPLLGFEVHRVYAGSGGLRLLVPTFLHALAGAAVAAAVPAALLRRGRRSPIPTVAHGSARWGTGADAREAGLFAARGEGLHLGYLDPGCRRPLTDASDHHVLCFAPPGMGKTTALVIPTLLELRSSAWVLDPKGELWESTAAFSWDVRIDSPLPAQVRSVEAQGAVDAVGVDSVPSDDPDTAVADDTTVTPLEGGDPGGAQAIPTLSELGLLVLGLLLAFGAWRALS